MGPVAGRLTEGFREPKHLLVVDIRLVPDEIVGQVWGRGKPLPEEAALHRHHEVHLHEVEGNGWMGEADPQDGLVARRAAAQITQPHLAARDGDFLLQGLERQITVRDSHGVTGAGKMVTPLVLLFKRQRGERRGRRGGEERRSRN